MWFNLCVLRVNAVSYKSNKLLFICGIVVHCTVGTVVCVIHDKRGWFGTLLISKAP